MLKEKSGVSVTKALGAFTFTSTATTLADSTTTTATVTTYEREKTAGNVESDAESGTESSGIQLHAVFSNPLPAF